MLSRRDPIPARQTRMSKHTDDVHMRIVSALQDVGLNPQRNIFDLVIAIQHDIDHLNRSLDVINKKLDAILEHDKMLENKP